MTGVLPHLLLPGTLCDALVFPAALHEDGAQVQRIDRWSSVADAVAVILSTAPQRFVLTGFSLGGVVALSLAAAAPNRIAGLCVIAASPGPVPQDCAEAARADLARARSDGLDAHVARAVLPHADAAHHPLLREMAQKVGPDGLAHQTELSISRPDARPFLACLDMPTLMIFGGDDPLCPAEAAADYARALPNLRLHRLPGAGHYLPLDQPQTLALIHADWSANLR